MLFDRYCEDKPTAKVHGRIRRAGTGSKDFHLTPNTPLPCREAILEEEFKEQKSPRQHPVWNNVQLLTNLIVSSPMRRRTSRSVVICWRPQLAVEKRLGSSVTTLTFTSCSSTGHGGILSGRTSRWRSGTGRCLTYAQQ